MLTFLLCVIGARFLCHAIASNDAVPAFPLRGAEDVFSYILQFCMENMLCLYIPKLSFFGYLKGFSKNSKMYFPLIASVNDTTAPAEALAKGGLLRKGQRNRDGLPRPLASQ